MISITKQLKILNEKTPKAVKAIKALDSYNTNININNTKSKLLNVGLYKVKTQSHQQPTNFWQSILRNQKRCWCFYKMPFQLLLLLLLKFFFAVVLMPNGITMVEATFVERPTLPAATAAAIQATIINNNNMKAYMTTIRTATEMSSFVEYDYHDDDDGDYSNADDGGDITEFTLSLNKAKNTKVALTTTTNTNTTFTSTTIINNNVTTMVNIKRNMWTNINYNNNSNKKMKRKRNSFENISKTNLQPTKASTTNALTSTPTPTSTSRVTVTIATATAKNPDFEQQNHHQYDQHNHHLHDHQHQHHHHNQRHQLHQDLFESPNVTKAMVTTISTTPATSINESSIYLQLATSTMASQSSPSSSSSSLTTFQPPFTDLNITFHQYCLASRSSFADLVTIILYSIVCIIGLFGNTLVIYVVLRFSKMQTVTNIYILNLAIADECFLIGIPFLLYTMRICSWTFGKYICKAYMVSTSITQFTSSIFLLIMSADRFIAVCHPIASPRYRTINIAKIVSSLAWLTSVILMLPVILFASTILQEDEQHYSCNIEWPEIYKKHSGTTFILYTFFLGFALPLCFILTFYYLVIKKLHAVGRKHKSKEKKRSHRKVTRLVLTVITVYILCWLPHWISQVALISSNPDQRDLSRFEILIFLLLGCLAYSNSAMNPILYAFLSDNFRKSFSKAFTCMNRHEVNAQLQIEPSVFTKHGGSRRRNSKRLMMTQTIVKTKATLHAVNPKTITMGNNNSSTTTTSSTTTQNEKNIMSVVGGSGGGGGFSGGGASGSGCSGGGGGGGMFSSTTTTAPTMTTTLTTSTGNSIVINQLMNDGISTTTTTPTPLYQTTTNGRINIENCMLVLDKKQETGCITILERSSGNQPTGCGSGNTLQTDL